MDLVMDANILFAALIKDSTTSDMLFRESFSLYTPEFIFTEFTKYKYLLKSKTKRSGVDFDRFVEILQRRITVVQKEEILPFLEQAKKISPDAKDVPYIALAIKLKASLWSNGRELKEKQSVVKVYSTEDLMKI